MRTVIIISAFNKVSLQSLNKKSDIPVVLADLHIIPEEIRFVPVAFKLFNSKSFVCPSRRHKFAENRHIFINRVLITVQIVKLHKHTAEQQLWYNYEGYKYINADHRIEGR